MKTIEDAIGSGFTVTFGRNYTTQRGKIRCFLRRAGHIYPCADGVADSASGAFLHATGHLLTPSEVAQ